jgi:hypothetical protein
MARKPRLHVPGGLYHVRLRGKGGQDIFSDDEDRYHLYLLIQQGVERYVLYVGRSHIAHTAIEHSNGVRSQQ